MTSLALGHDPADPRNSPSQLPDGYEELLDGLKKRVRATRVQAVRAANTVLIGLYWSVGNDILQRQADAGWGTRVIDRLAEDLRSEFPEQRGWSRSNLHYMRSFASTWPNPTVVPHAVGQLPWGHIRLLLDKLRDGTEQEWYAKCAVENGWSRDVLAHQIASQLMNRTGVAPSNFETTLVPEESELAQQMLRDPYVFDYLSFSGRISEAELEKGLIDRIQDTLLALGHDFAFVGRQMRFKVEDDELVLDLLLFHINQLRYIVIELKIGPFESAYVGQLGTYVSLIDDRMRKPDRHAPTVGILLCANKNETIVRYALSGTSVPMAVATYTYDTLPEGERIGLPTATQLIDATRSAPEETSGGAS